MLVKCHHAYRPTRECICISRVWLAFHLSLLPRCIHHRQTSLVPCKIITRSDWRLKPGTSAFAFLGIVFAWRDSRKTLKSSVKISCLPAGCRTPDFPNTKYVYWLLRNVRRGPSQVCHSEAQSAVNAVLTPEKEARLITVQSPTYAVNWFWRFPRKLKNRVSRTVLKYEVFLTYMSVSNDKAKQVLLMKRKLWENETLFSILSST
jgi:hypothetical protein